jgi:hypothetical protein
MRRDGATWRQVIAETGIKTNSTGFRVLLEANGYDKFGRLGGKGESKAKGWGSAELSAKHVAATRPAKKRTKPSVPAKPDTAQVLGGLKDFQLRTVDHVFNRLYAKKDPAYRFLVADEVGLGKTLVARGVIARAVDRLWNEVDRIDVVYICSNADIARQNLDRLNIAGDDDAVLSSRLTMLASQVHGFRDKKLHFVSFTPGTSFEKTAGLGRADERVLLYWLLRSPWRLGDGVAPLNVLQWFSGSESFRRQIDSFDPQQIDPVIRRAFHKRLREREADERAAGRRSLRRRFRELCAQLPRARDYWRIPDDVNNERTDVVATLRAVLAASCVTALEPDLVILDEFQRFRYLLDPQDDSSRLAHELFNYERVHEAGSFDERCRVLMLSATPYKMYTTAADPGEEDHYKDFLETVAFLFGREAPTEELRALLNDLRTEMLRLEETSRERVLDIRGRIEELLREVMVRTERLAVTDDRNGMLTTIRTNPPKLASSDVSAYLALQRTARDLDHPDVLEYWKSAPYPLNFMDDGDYKLKRDFTAAADERKRGSAASGSDTRAGLLNWRDIERYRNVDSGNPRLRQLHEEMIESKAWRLLWLPPSLPYYELAGPFGDPELQRLTKRLVFSAWKVVPKALASVLSYSAEREMMRSRGGRPVNTQKARAKRARLLEFSRRSGRLGGMPVLALMYPSPTLAREVDPLSLSREFHAAEGRTPTRTELAAIARERCTGMLEQFVAVHRGKAGEEDEAWYWAAPILLDKLRAPDATTKWFDDVDISEWSGERSTSTDIGSSGFADHVERARQLVEGEIELGRPPADLEAVVADLALGAPAVCVLRALRRVGGDEAAFGDTGRTSAAAAAFALRRLFNAPEVTALVRGARAPLAYWRRVLEYSIDGGIQAVLDEYAHVLVEALGLIDKPAELRVTRIAAEMGRSIGIRASQLRVDDVDLARTDGPAIKRRDMRARFAARFGVEENPEDGTEPTRSDAIRSSFNSPFWPFVLASTSVGQEGLDFHLYCHAVVHWNLPSNPVDLEQREGRVHRYKGHAVRKNLAATHGAQALRSDTEDTWSWMFDAAKAARPESDTDLVPYWIYDGDAKIERHVPTLPLSGDTARLNNLLRSLAVYRMVFGQPRQDDLVELLLAQLSDEDRARRQALLDELRIDLSPDPSS